MIYHILYIKKIVAPRVNWSRRTQSARHFPSRNFTCSSWQEISGKNIKQVFLVQMHEKLCHTCSSQIRLAEGDISTAVSLYRQSGSKQLKTALKLASSGNVAELLSFLQVLYHLTETLKEASFFSRWFSAHEAWTSLKLRESTFQTWRFLPIVSRHWPSQHCQGGFVSLK